jgi:hypothetical protein
MTALIKVQNGQIDVDRMIRLGMLSESYCYDAHSFLNYMLEQGYNLIDPEGWAAYQDELRKTHSGRRYEAATYNRKIAASFRISGG